MLCALRDFDLLRNSSNMLTAFFCGATPNTIPTIDYLK